jgi:regulator of replication initiation timing
MFAEISGAIGAVKQLLALKGIKDNAEAMLAISTLQVQLAEVQDRLANMLNENRELRGEVDRLKGELADAKNPKVEVEFKEGVYYKPNGDGPYCPTCYDTKKQMVRVGEAPSFVQDDYGRWHCGACDNYFGKKDRPKDRISFGEE